MSTVHCFTSISFAYLDRARILAETVRRFHPDWLLWLCLSDREPSGFNFDISNESFDHIVPIDYLHIPNLDSWTFGHNVVELCTAVKGPMLCYLLERGAEKVIYLDPDIALFSSLENVIELLDQHTIVLTPHLTIPETSRQGIVDNEIGSLKHGTFNLGFIAVKNSPEGYRFAQWWRDRLAQFCYEDIPAGLFTDQRWCDLVPSLFEGTYILRDPGYNVACWNLRNRPISILSNGDITAADVPLRFFHFTKIASIGEEVLAYNNSGQLDVFELVRWYKSRLAVHTAKGISRGWWAFSQYQDGEIIAQADRILYRSHPFLRERFPFPFASGPDTFQTWRKTQSELSAGYAGYYDKRVF